MGNSCCQDQSRDSNHKPSVIQRARTVKKQDSKPTVVAQTVLKGKRVLNRHGPDNYQSIKYLGRGAFGDVVLAEEKMTGKQYAMKIIEKSKIKEINVLQCELIEKVSAKSQLVSIKETFQNDTRIYIIMEYLTKGDLYFYFRLKNFRFQQGLIKDLMAEIITGISVLHDFDIVYRQLKPENILVTNEGHLKLNDYGLSKMIIGKDFSSTYVGPLEYIAPEALTGHYNKKVDIWTIGVLMFELKFGRTPFATVLNELQPIVRIKKSLQTLNVEEVLLEKKNQMSQDFFDLISKLLRKNPEDRISLEQVKMHPLFKEVDWEMVSQRKNPPPLGEFIQNDDIKFRNPNEQYVNRPFVSTNQSSIKTNLHQFCNEQTSF